MLEVKEFRKIVDSGNTTAAKHNSEMLFEKVIEEMKQQLNSFIEAFATAVDNRTPYNASHARKVTEYTGLMVDYINKLYKNGKCDIYFDKKRYDQLIMAAALHDIGKIGISDNVLNKHCL